MAGDMELTFEKRRSDLAKRPRNMEVAVVRRESRDVYTLE
jgi:hypothetical protein